jgi:hypothetical protein
MLSRMLRASKDINMEHSHHNFKKIKRVGPFDDILARMGFKF